MNENNLDNKLEVKTTKNKLATNDIALIGIMLAIGVVFKLTTDVLFRTILFMFLIDVLLLTDTLIFMKYPKFKVAIIIVVIQTLLSATLFMATDIWFFRPIVVLISFLCVKFFNNKNISITKKYMLSNFFSSMIKIFVLCIIILVIILFLPDFFSIEEFQKQVVEMSNTLPLDQGTKELLDSSVKELLIIGVTITAMIFSLIPATIHLIFAYFISKIFKIENRFFK